MSTPMLPAAIIAGGLATRLRPLTEKIPKSLIDINGEPFLAHQLRLLHSQGIRRIVLCTGYLTEMIQDYTGDGSRFGLAIAYSPDGPTLRGTAGTIRQALPLLGDRFFVLYGDSYLPCPYAPIQQSFLDSGKLALMTVYRNQSQWDTSNVEFAAGRIVAYDKVNRTPRMHFIDYGLGVLDRRAFDHLPAGEPYDLARLYQDMLAREQLAGFEVAERFYEIGSFAGIEDLSQYLLRKGPPQP